MALVKGTAWMSMSGAVAMLYVNELGDDRGCCKCSLGFKHLGRSTKRTFFFHMGSVAFGTFIIALFRFIRCRATRRPRAQTPRADPARRPRAQPPRSRHVTTTQPPRVPATRDRATRDRATRDRATRTRDRVTRARRRYVFEVLDYSTRKHREGNIMMKLLFKCIKCCLYCMEKTVEFISNWGFIFVAAHGTPFCRSCFDAFGFQVKYLSHPISRPIPSPVPSHPIPPRPIPSHPVPSHPIPSHPIPGAARRGGRAVRRRPRDGRD